VTHPYAPLIWTALILAICAGATITAAATAHLIDKRHSIRDRKNGGAES
jgi:hypothetical protein